MPQTVALVTNVTQYAGPAGATALAADGFRTVCHDHTFTDFAVRDAFAAENPALMPIAEQEPEAMLAAHGHVDVVLSNDYVPPEALGEFNIQLNAIGPNWFENPTYFPPGLWERDADLRALVAQEVPLQRLGQEHEMGALIAFLASGRATPVTGQFFGFTGGWLP